MPSSFFLSPPAGHLHPPPSPTRRSSDLSPRRECRPIAPRAGSIRFLDHVGVHRSRPGAAGRFQDRKSTRLNSSHLVISYAVFCLKKKNREVDLTLWGRFSDAIARVEWAG